MKKLIDLELKKIEKDLIPKRVELNKFIEEKIEEFSKVANEVGRGVKLSYKEMDSFLDSWSHPSTS